MTRNGPARGTFKITCVVIVTSGLNCVAQRSPCGRAAASSVCTSVRLGCADVGQRVGWDEAAVGVALCIAPVSRLMYRVSTVLP